MKYRLKLMGLAVLVFSVSLFTGCESENPDIEITPSVETPSSNTITGTAAAGLPIVGIVNVKGANGLTASADIDSDGHFDLVVTDLTAPYILFARGTVNNESVELYSTGVATGNINITPITNLITNRVLGSLDGAFTSWDTVSATVDTAAITAAETQVETQLAPILAAYGITGAIDLMSVDFNPDHTGLDAILDILDITIDESNVVTITNTATGTTVTGTEVFTAAETTALTAVISETAAMNVIWAAISNLYATSLPTATQINTEIAPKIADDFLSEGRSKTQELDNWLSGNGPGIGLVFSSSITRLMTSTEYSAAYSKGYWINLFYQMGTESGIFNTSMVYDGTNWLWHGDQRWMGASFRSVAAQKIAADNSVFYRTTLIFRMDDRQNYAYNQGARSAIITGPGLPAGGLVMDRDYPNDSFRIYNGSTSDEIDITSDAAAAAIPDNSEYTLTLYDASPDVVLTTPGTLLKSYKEKIGGAPYGPTELTPGLFPVFSTPAAHAIVDANIGGALTVTWTNAPAVAVHRVNMWVEGDGQSLDFRKDVTPGDSSADLDTSTNNIVNINAATLSLAGIDLNNREFRVEWLFQ